MNRSRRSSAFTATRVYALLTILLSLGFGFTAMAEETKPADARPKVSISEKGFKVTSADGRYMFDIGGRVQVDFSTHFGNVEGANSAPQSYGASVPINGAELRRARIETKARMGGDFFFFGDIGFADNKTGIKDFLLGYDGLSGFKLIVGNQKQPYSLVVEESSNDISFIERGIDSALVNQFGDRAIGIRLEGTGDQFFVAGGVFGGSPSPDTETDGWGFAGRAVVAPILNDDSVLHVGFRTLFRKPSPDDQGVRLRAETTHHSSLYLVDTGNLLESTTNGFRDITMFGPELVYAYRFMQLKGEYNYAHLRRRGVQPVALQSGHVSLSLALSGQNWADAYKMSAGEFRHLKNKNDFNPKNGRWGGLELAARWSFLDLSDGDVTGGREHAVSTSLIWSLNYNVRVMLDWTRAVKTEGPAWNDPVNSSGQGLDMLTVRTQFSF